MTISPIKYKSTQGVVTADGNTLVTAGKGCIAKIVLSVATTARWFKFYDKATVPTIADTPILRVWVPVGATVDLELTDAGGLPFVNGFGYRSSVAGIDNDATYTAFAANDSAVTTFYQTD